MPSVKCTTLVGIDAFPVDVEAHIIGVVRRFTIVGLPDGILKESRGRVRCAIENSGFMFPYGEVIVSLAPASLPKFGAGFDAAIGISVLVANQQIKIEALRDRIILGELALDGSIRPVAGVLATACYAKKARINQLIVPAENCEQAALISGIQVYPVRSFVQLVAFLNNQIAITPYQATSSGLPSQINHQSNFGDVVGQHAAKRALEVVAAGGHNLLMVGPPGVGKTMLAKRLVSILPPLSTEESIEVTKIHSCYNASITDDEFVNNGKGIDNNGQFLLITSRPFRSPHHTTSTAGLIGGGSNPIPGEISLAHRGILFLDELAEFKRDVLESLRQPMESRNICICRAKLRLVFPADFVLVAAMNPCPCGKRGLPDNSCACSLPLIKRYKARLSGPFLDRIDMQIWVPRVPVSELALQQNVNKQIPLSPTTDLTNSASPNCSTSVTSRINNARLVQRQRFGRDSKVNAHMTNLDLRKYCSLHVASQKILNQGAEKFAFSARAYNRTLRIARTIADLEGNENIEHQHIAEALSYRLENI